MIHRRSKADSKLDSCADLSALTSIQLSEAKEYETTMLLQKINQGNMLKGAGLGDCKFFNTLITTSTKANISSI